MISQPTRPPLRERLRLYGHTARRSASRYGLSPFGALGPLVEEPIFVVGCPRSGTTFTAGAIGRAPDFVDLGEVSRIKAAIPELHAAVLAGGDEAVTRELRAILRTSQRVAMAARRRVIEQTPESTFLIPQLAAAFPRAHFVHVVRDGRDVVTSLVERGWLAGDDGEFVRARAGGESVDEAGHRFGGYARFWVEPGREREFETAGELRRCAWAWRRYVTTARSALALVAPSRVTTIRYEQLVARPAALAARVAAELGAPAAEPALAEAFAGAHTRSVGRHRGMLAEDELCAVHAEAGALLEELGY